jgi:hypothetical protein
MDFTTEEIMEIVDIIPKLVEEIDSSFSEFLLFLVIEFEFELMLRYQGSYNTVELSDFNLLRLYEVWSDYSLSDKLGNKLISEIQFRGLEDC